MIKTVHPHNRLQVCRTEMFWQNHNHMEASAFGTVSPIVDYCIKPSHVRQAENSKSSLHMFFSSLFRNKELMPPALSAGQLQRNLENFHSSSSSRLCCVGSWGSVSLSAGQEAASVKQLSLWINLISLFFSDNCQWKVKWKQTDVTSWLDGSGEANGIVLEENTASVH